ncbi:MAG: hypothetical protein LQ352_005581, partial [Teloschistes flavicans]
LEDVATLLVVRDAVAEVTIAEQGDGAQEEGFHEGKVAAYDQDFDFGGGPDAGGDVRPLGIVVVSW